jgi:hypothetical protein
VIKGLKKLGLEGMYLSMTKAINDIPIANFLLSKWRKTETISSKARERRGT